MNLNVHFSRYRQAKMAGIVLLTVAVLMVYQIMPMMTKMVAQPPGTDSKLLISIEPEAAAKNNRNVTDEFPLTQGKDNALKLQMFNQRHWEFQILDKGNRVDCQIYTKPINSNGQVDGNLPSLTQTGRSGKEQYIIHIHGLHHTGTGYLRQTLYDALNNEFSVDGDPSPVASMQDSMRPYQHLLDEANGDKTKTYQLRRKYHVPEEEGHHLQSLYPSFVYRAKEFQNTPGVTLMTAGRLPYLADLCSIKGDTIYRGPFKNKRIGNKMFHQWSQYWDMSATFLLQKTPAVDVLFLEKTKVLPTLHVIIVRHPMTRNTWGMAGMTTAWVTTWAHVFELLQEGKVDWYAVVTYEALISHHDQVTKELMEVVRSGVNRHGRNSGRRLQMAASNNENGSGRKEGNAAAGSKQSTTSGRRRLHYHDDDNPRAGPSSNLSDGDIVKHLSPKEASVNSWNACVAQSRCHRALDRLTRGVLPYFGYVNLGRLMGPLSSSPGPVTVSNEFDRVLFSSEGDALNKLKQSDKNIAGDSHVDYRPSLEMVARMKDTNPS